MNISKNTTKIRKCEHLLISADKTTNYNKVTPTTMINLLTQTSIIITISMEITINEEDKQTAFELNINDRVNMIAKQQSSVTLKDHKQNFNNKPTSTMINSAKGEIGKSAKDQYKEINNDQHTLFHHLYGIHVAYTFLQKS